VSLTRRSFSAAKNCRGGHCPTFGQLELRTQPPPQLFALSGKILFHSRTGGPRRTMVPPFTVNVPRPLGIAGPAIEGTEVSPSRRETGSRILHKYPAGGPQFQSFQAGRKWMTPLVCGPIKMASISHQARIPTDRYKMIQLPVDSSQGLNERLRCSLGQTVH